MSKKRGEGRSGERTQAVAEPVSERKPRPRSERSWTPRSARGILGAAVTAVRPPNFTLADEHVRAALIRYLAASSSGDARENRIVEELGLCQGAARVDIALIRADGIWGYEIKSDRDSLARLVHQTEWYSRVLDSIVVVAGETHGAQLERCLPRWWGIWIARGEPERVSFSVAREPERNPSRDIHALVQLLWRAEAVEALSSLGLRAARAADRKTIWRRLVSSQSEEQVAATVRKALCARTDWPRRASVQFLADVG